LQHRNQAKGFEMQSEALGFAFFATAFNGGAFPAGWVSVSCNQVLAFGDRGAP
jgi:hypothetical protein